MIFFLSLLQQLWVLIVVEADLFGQLKLLKDFFLFGRGDLYQAFIDVAHPFLKTVPTAATEHGKFQDVCNFS